LSTTSKSWLPRFTSAPVAPGEEEHHPTLGVGSLRGNQPKRSGATRIVMINDNEEVADYLQICRSTVNRMAERAAVACLQGRRPLAIRFMKPSGTCLFHAGK